MPRSKDYSFRFISIDDLASYFCIKPTGVLEIQGLINVVFSPIPLIEWKNLESVM